MSLWPFCDKIQDYVNFGDAKAAYLSALAKRLAFSDRVWLLRPDLDPLLAALLQAKQTGKITGCFILTNNGSENITEIVRQMLNFRAQTLMSGGKSTVNTPVNLFSIYWTRGSPCRKKHGVFVKSINSIQDCLATAGLPTINRIGDLLFYDDSEHQLSKEIPHYSQVKAYNHYTPVSLIFMEIKGIMERFGIDRQTIDYIYKYAQLLEDKDLKENRALIQRAPSEKEASGYSLLQDFAHFLQGSPVRKSKMGVTKGTKGSKTTRKSGSPRSKTRRAARIAKN
jgi:hypothetical protein